MVLGVDPKAKSEVIQKAYQALAFKYNPRGGKEASAEKFEAVGLAYEVLIDPVLRQSFDSLRPMLVTDQAVLVRGSVRLDENGPPKVAVADITPLDVARLRLPRQVFMKVRLSNGLRASGSDVAERLAELFRDEREQVLVFHRELE